MTRITLNERERATVLAALKHWQSTPSEQTEQMNELATGGDRFPALTIDEISDLSKRLTPTERRTYTYDDGFTDGHDEGFSDILKAGSWHDDGTFVVEDEATLQQLRGLVE